MSIKRLEHSNGQQYSSVDKLANIKILQAIFLAEAFAAFMFFFVIFVYGGKSIYEGLIISTTILILSGMPLFIDKFTNSADYTSLVLSITFPLTYLVANFVRFDVGAISIWASVFLLFAISLFYVSKRIIITVSIVGILFNIIVWIYNPNITVHMGVIEYISRVTTILLTALLSIYVNKRYKGRLNEGLIQIQRITELNSQLDASREKLINQNKDLVKTSEKVNRMAYYEQQTNLPNRNKLIADLKDIPLLDNDGKMIQLALIYFDIENHKLISMHHGKDLAESFVGKIATYINDTFKQVDGELYRISPNEFVYIINEYERPQEVINLVKKVINVFSNKVASDTNDISLDFKIGMALYPEHGLTLNSLLRKATIAISSIRNKSNHNYQMYNEVLMATFERKVAIQEGLKTAMKDMYLSFQPIYAIPEHTIIGFEALLRWDSLEHGFISPSEFIPYAEENMTIIPIGLWVLEEALSVLNIINSALQKSYTMSINISGVQLKHKNFLQDFRLILNKSGVDPKLVELEITENILIDAITDILDILLELRMLGIKISLDDFGTGYSSLAYLHKLPIDIIKIDRTFISDLSISKDDSLVHTILAMAKQLGQIVVAEGVETKEQLALLMETSCKYVQGYLLCRPIDFRSGHKFFEILENLSSLENSNSK